MKKIKRWFKIKWFTLIRPCYKITWVDDDNECLVCSEPLFEADFCSKECNDIFVQSLRYDY